ncbi:MAG: hypothetical protein JSW65_00465 [Candidatus Bipolaricaulota bacterium]|nr:MAG: hypothetical protein JSW65_00465 [Candidatus Bipolaricaulota bacterium]
MTAGLPKARMVSLLTSIACLALLLTPLAVQGQEVQTPSSVIPLTLEIIAASPALSDEQKAALSTQFEDAAAGEYITDDQGVALLEAAGFTALVEGDDPTLVLEAIALVLSAITSGALDPEGAITTLSVWAANGGTLEALAGLLEEQASPPGILNAIGGALGRGGYLQTDSDTVFVQVELLIQAGVPPGIVLRVAKQTIRDGEEADLELLLAQLQYLGELIAAGESPGHAANAATGRGRHRHQEEEQNANASDGVPPGQQKEKENNGNGNGKSKKP